jgi:hypothetical protein
VLDHEEIAAGVGWDNFESERTETEGMEMAGTVFAGGDGMNDGSIGRFG